MIMELLSMAFDAMEASKHFVEDAMDAL